MPSSYSQVDICNLALTRLGTKHIVSIDEGTKNSRQCAVVYPMSRDFVLRAHAWNFATKRASLAREATGPSYQYTYYFALPDGFMRLLALSDSAIEYKLENNMIACDEETLNIKYIHQITDEGKFEAAFISVLAWKIAWDIAIPITSNSRLMRDMRDSYNFDMLEAQNLNSVEDGQIGLSTTEWLNSRA